MPEEFWERAAQQDPLWAILSDPTKRNRGWDTASFFENGRREIALLLQRLKTLRRMPRTGRALDFGCGVGRLTQALAATFDEVIGVDASPTMLRLAGELNQHGSKVRYVLNTAPVLESIPSNSIDLLYTDIVLQHLEPVQAIGYVADFMRVLAPGGVAVFQLPSKKRTLSEMPARPEAMAPQAYRARLEFVEPPPATLAPGQTAVVKVRVGNVSGMRWDQHRFGILRLGNHWKSTAGDMVVQDDGRVAVPVELSRPVELPLEIKAPSETGTYVCEFDLVHEGFTWFADRGSDVLRAQIAVTSASETDAAGGDVAPAAESAPTAAEFAATDTTVAAVPAAPLVDINALLPQSSDLIVDPFPMHGVSRAVVEELVRTTGGVLFKVDDDERAGPEWESHMYYVEKPAKV